MIRLARAADCACVELCCWPPQVKFAAAHGITIGSENCLMCFTSEEQPKGQDLASTPARWQKLREASPTPPSA